MAGWFNWKIEWQNFTPWRLVEWLGEVRAAQVERQVTRVAERNAQRIQEWMQANAPWTDRTGDARAALRAEVIDVTGHAALILLRHGVSYSVFLETIQAGRFSILMPALDHWAPIIWRDIQIELAAGQMIQGD
jgi:hypothetical protein